MFTTEYGVASLMLREIPYRQEAYIHIRSVQPGYLKELLCECLSFCRMAGAEQIYATGHEGLQDYPLHAAVLQMQLDAWVDQEKLENLFPVTDSTVSQWRQIFNERMKQVDCAATLTAFEEKDVLASGGAYFVHRRGELLGIGWIQDQELRAVCSVVPGAGERIMHTLMSLIEGSTMRLEVASTNQKAIRLYEKLGFLRISEKIRWYKIFSENIQQM